MLFKKSKKPEKSGSDGVIMKPDIQGAGETLIKPDTSGGGFNEQASLIKPNEDSRMDNEEKQRKLPDGETQAAEGETERRIEELLSGNGGGENRIKKRKKSKVIKRIIIIAAVIVVLLLLKALFTEKETVLPLTSALSRTDIESSLTITGPIEGTDSVDVTSNLHAKVIELNVKEGDRVAEGETVLARLDTADIQKEIANARGSYELSEAQKKEKLRDDQALYEKAVQELKTAEEDHNRKSALFQTGDIAAVDYEASVNALNDARRAVNGFNVKNGKVVPDESLDIEIENTRRALSQVEDKLDEAVIKAPISGTVTRVYTKVGQFADKTDDSNNPMIVIENLDELQMKISISEYSIGEIEVGQPVVISADILGGETVEGEIASISPTGEEKGGGSSERVIPTIVRIKENSKLIAGITAKAKIVLKEEKDVFTVPISAVYDDGTGNKYMQFVIPKEDADKENEGADKAPESALGTVKTVPVETGIESDINVEIKAILNDTDAPLLKEGSLYLTTYDKAFEGVSGKFAGL